MRIVEDGLNDDRHMCCAWYHGVWDWYVQVQDVILRDLYSQPDGFHGLVRVQGTT